MIEPCEAVAGRVGNIVAALLRASPGQTVLLEWAEQAILIYLPDGNEDVREVALCSRGSLNDGVDRCDCHAVE